MKYSAKLKRFARWVIGCSVGGLVTLAASAQSPNQITGQWDFDQGDLRATIGQDLEYGDGPIQTQTFFGTTTQFGIPDIGGQPAKVMKYLRNEAPLDNYVKGYIVHHGIAPNGGGVFVNQWTLVVDVLFPDLHQGDKYSAIIKARDDPSSDGDIFVFEKSPGVGGIGISGQYDGSITAGQWHRLVVAVDMSGGAPVISKFVDGVKAADQTNAVGIGLDGRFALTNTAHLFSDGGNDHEVNTFYVNSIQIWSGKLSDSQVAALGGIPLALDVTQPGDPIVASSNNSPGSEGVANLIDNNTGTKYLNFDKLNTGFTVTPSVGATIVTGIGLTSANDAPERDPASFTVEGSNNGTNFTLIASNTVPSFPSRFTEQDFTFPNTSPYKIYRVRFPTVANAATANSMQIAEVQLFGVVVQSIPRRLHKYTLLSNPFKTGGNTLNDIIPSILEGSTALPFNTLRTTFTTSVFIDGWKKNLTIPAGTGYFIYTDVDQDILLFGQLLPQTTKFTLIPGYNLVGAIWTTNRASTNLNLSPDDGDTILLWDQSSQSYNIYVFDDIFGDWSSSFIIKPGDGFFVRVSRARDWILNP